MRNTLEKWESLLVRACKSRNPERRLRKLFRHTYGLHKDVDPLKGPGALQDLAGICDVCGLFGDMPVFRLTGLLISEQSQVELWNSLRPHKAEPQPTLSEGMTKVLISRIKLTDTNRLILCGWHPPLAWRKKHTILKGEPA